MHCIYNFLIVEFQIWFI